MISKANLLPVKTVREVLPCLLRVPYVRMYVLPTHCTLNKQGRVIQYIGIPLTVLFLTYRMFIMNKTINRKKKLQGKVVFISGASSGVGEALAHCFHGYGCKVILAARRENQLARVKKNLVAKKLDCKTYDPMIVYLDLSDKNSIEQAIQKSFDECGHIDILINNGGISCRGNVLSTQMDVFKKLMDINYFGQISLTKGVLPKMISQKSGHILFVSSVQGRIAIPDRAAYSASKHACQAFADSLRAEMKKHDISVSVVSPGYIKTALSVNALTGSGQQYGEMDATTAAGYSPDFVAEKIIEMIVSNTHELVLAPLAPRIAILLRCIASSIYFWLMAKRAK